MPPEICPNCGAEVPRNAKVCPECGSDESSGWSEQARADNLGLPDEHFDYDEFVKEEFGSGRHKPRGISWFWWGIAILLVVLMLLWFVK
ncbi:MAG TPA: zinc ribbon domain-containing protein [Verrucomicrobiae bacterium]|nr:zinc ribbon domain-containing protein [Verrucomicrobiae bacterium]